MEESKSISFLPRAAEQAVAARRLDSVVVKHLPKVKVGCCSLGAAEQRRWAAS